MIFAIVQKNIQFRILVRACVCMYFCSKTSCHKLYTYTDEHAENYLVCDVICYFYFLILYFVFILCIDFVIEPIELEK